MSNFEINDRIYLGKVAGLQAITTPPSSTPAAGSGIIENVCTWPEVYVAGGGAGPQRYVVWRAMLVEVVVRFAGADPYTSVDVIPYTSRVNPVDSGLASTGEGGKLDRDTDDTDTWDSFGGQTVRNAASTSGGNKIRITVEGSRWIKLISANATGGSGGDRVLTAYLYAVRERRGGI